MNRRSHILVASFIYITIILYFATFMFVYFSINIGNQLQNVRSKEKRDGEVHFYKLLQRNYELNHTNFGIYRFVTDGQNQLVIPPGEGIFYGDPDMKTNTLVSNIGETEYECFGTCICTPPPSDELEASLGEEDDNFFSIRRRRRRTASNGAIGGFVQVGISYLLVAITSVLAYQKASEYFLSRCIEHCPPDSIDVEVDVSSTTCESIIVIEGKETQYYEDVENKLVRKKNNKNIYGDVNDYEEYYYIEEELPNTHTEVGQAPQINEEMRRYFCYGNCLNNNRLKIETAVKKAKELFPECRSLKAEGEVKVYESDVLKHGFNDLKKSGSFQDTARTKFQSLRMTSFCKVSSRFEYIQIRERKLKSGKLLVNEIDRESSACVGTNRRRAGLKNVRCVQVEPKREFTNIKPWRDKKWWEDKEKWENEF